MPYSPDKYVRRIGNIGSPLPPPFFSLETHRIQFRRGATSMIAGTPGSCKTVFALNMMTTWARDDIGCQYFAADSDEFTTIKRLSGILTGDHLDAIERNILTGKNGRYVNELRKIDVAQFEYEQMDMATIGRRVKSYEQIFGSPPDVVFIDNLINFADTPDDWGGMLVMTRELDALAREIRAHVVILHHAKLRTASANGKPPQFGRPPADWEIQGKITQIPRLVLTVAAENMSVRLACVKNTNGPSNPDASVYLDFTIAPSMRVNELSLLTGKV